MLVLRVFFLWLSLSVLSNALKAQQYPMQHFDVDDGVSSNIVYDVIQDDEGFMWFATPSGIVRYDGKYWQNFSLLDSLSDNEILKIKKDGRGRLWLLAFNGTISIFDHGKVYSSFNHPLLKQLGPGFFYRYIYADKDTVWLSNFRTISAKVNFPNTIEKLSSERSVVFNTAKGHVGLESLVLPDSFRRFKKRVNEYNYLGIKQWGYDGDSVFVAIIDSFLISIDRSGNKKIAPIQLPSYNSILDVYFDNERNMWVTVEKQGVFCFALNHDGYRLKGIYKEGEYITSTFQDNENNIWFTTYGNGVYKMSSSYTNSKIYTKEDGLFDNELYSVYVDEKQHIWTGHKYAQLSSLVGKRSNVKRLNNIGRLGRILKIDRHPNLSLLLATDAGFFVVPPNGALISLESSNKIPYVTKDFIIKDNGDVLVVCQEEMFEIKSADVGKNNKHQKLNFPKLRYYSACINEQNVLWYSCFDGLMQYKNGMTLNLKERYPVLANRVSDLCVCHNRVYACIVGYGVVVLEGENMVYHLNTKNGLSSNLCSSLYVKDGKVYVCSNKGVNVVALVDKKYVIEQITVADGLISNQVNDVCVQNNILYAATSKGLSEIDLIKLKEKATNVVKIYFTHILWKGKDILAQKNPLIDYVDKYLRFEFISPCFSIPEAVLYRYRLNEGPWYETQNSSLEFNSLSPGTYNLQVSAKHLGSAWSAAVVYPFRISQPFYMSVYFYLVLALAGIAIFFIVNHYRIRRLQQKQQLTLEYEHKINRLQLQALQAMMNPHFIFNSLSAIQQQINIGDAGKAGTYLSRFAKLLRKNLETINEDYIAFEEEIERLKLYLESEKMRLEEKLTYRFDIDASLYKQDIIMPTMIIQPLIENAIWHGIMPKEGNGLIQIRAKKANDYLQFEIEDDGIGIEQAKALNFNAGKKSHFGLKITSDRLAIIEKKIGKKIVFSIVDLSKENLQGTLIKISLPLLYEN